MPHTSLFNRLPLAAGILLALASSLLAQDLPRWDEREIQANIIQRSEPTYPALAKQARVAGQVKLDLTIDADGKVEKVDTITGNPLLVGAATSAARTWKFKPPITDGKPGKVMASVVFTFKL